MGKKGITSARTSYRKTAAADHSSKSSEGDNGWFVIYTTDRRHFVIPLAFLSNTIFLELFKMSEEEFGLPSDRPITLPCDSVVMNYIVSLVKRGLSKDVESAVLISITSQRCLSDTCLNQGPADHQQWVL